MVSNKYTNNHPAYSHVKHVRDEVYKQTVRRLHFTLRKLLVHLQLGSPGARRRAGVEPKGAGPDCRAVPSPATGAALPTSMKQRQAKLEPSSFVTQCRQSHPECVRASLGEMSSGVGVGAHHDAADVSGGDGGPYLLGTDGLVKVPPLQHTSTAFCESTRQSSFSACLQGSLPLLPSCQPFNLCVSLPPLSACRHVTVRGLAWPSCERACPLTYSAYHPAGCLLALLACPVLA